MPLVVTQTPQGPVWENSDWDQNKPGTFAVVIGVSKYDYLPKNQEECEQELQKKEDQQESFGLCQLYVSAFTAYRFFCWLKKDYRHPNLPLAKVWLLLSPTDAEILHMPDLPSDSYRLPTFSNCQQAIIEWYKSVLNLKSFASESSRTLFFFSGHGLQLERDKQILLPSDYLNPDPVKNPATALSTFNLWTGMGKTPLPEHFFFVDACRNDNAPLKELEDLGIQVLPPFSSEKAKNKAICPIVYATGPGEASFAPKDPQEGISIFGQALMECLECNQGVGAWKDPQNKYWITFTQLADYLEPRVTWLLQGAGKQSVNIELGRKWNTPICLVKPPSARDVMRGGRAVLMADESTTLDPVPLPPGWRGPDHEWMNTYTIVQNEFMTNLLWNARVYDLGKGRGTDIREAVALEVLTFQGLARTEDRHTYTVEVEIHPRSPQWLEFNDAQNKQKAASVLLHDEQPDMSPRYTLRFDFMDQPNGSLAIAGLDVSLASSNKGVLQKAAQLWDQYRGSNVSDKATPAEFILLENFLAEKKIGSTLAATTAALLLLRAWRPDLLHNWLQNLADWFPARPDGWVIWVEQLLRTRQDEGMLEAVPALLHLEQLPLPLTSEALGHASRQVGELLQFAFPAPEQQTHDQRTQYEALKKLQQRLKRALALHRPGGFCAVFIGPEEKVTPELILPA